MPLQITLRRLFVIQLIVAVILVFGTIVWHYLPARYEPEPDIPFDVKGWLSVDPKDSNNRIRVQMVNDLLNRRFLGLNIQQLEHLLGKPYVGNIEDYDITYFLGPQRGIYSIDYEWLVFRLDSQGKVIEYKVLVR
jgi:hypothetical protein